MSREFLTRVQDKKPYIEVKDVIVARSGMYTYTREEVLARGHKPTRVKDFYTEFRPAGVIAASAGLFDMIPVTKKEHIDVEIGSDNFHDFSSAIIGGPISVVPMPNGLDIGLQGRIVFYTKDAHDYYKAGNRETSADYVSESVLVDNPDEVGYDLRLTKITSVNNVAITAMGRGGKDVRIQDSVFTGHTFDEIGRENMGLLSSILGIGGAGEKKFSAVIKDSLAEMRSATPERQKVIVGEVLERVAGFTPSDMRSALEGVVRDSFLHAEQALADWQKSATLIDGVYARCMDSEKELLAKVTDAGKGEAEAKKGEKEEKAGEKEEKVGEKEEEKGEKDEEKKSRAKDTAALVDERLKALLPDLITEILKKTLGAGGAEGPRGTRAIDSGIGLIGTEESVDYALEGIFGHSSGM